VHAPSPKHSFPNKSDWNVWPCDSISWLRLCITKSTKATDWLVCSCLLIQQDWRGECGCDQAHQPQKSCESKRWSQFHEFVLLFEASGSIPS
jgi:hypothetical protein